MNPFLSFFEINNISFNFASRYKLFMDASRPAETGMFKYTTLTKEEAIKRCILMSALPV